MKVKEIMPRFDENFVGLLRTKTVAGLSLAIAPDVIDLINQVAATGALPPQIAVMVRVVGVLLALWGRATAEKKVQGLV